MFCLPYPDECDRHLEPLQVPYVASYHYDLTIPGNFNNFAENCGFHDFDRSIDDLAALMQSWLFFGLMTEVLQQQINHDFFLRTRREGDTEHHYIDIRLEQVLDDLFTERFRSLQNLSGTHQFHILSRMAYYIRASGDLAVRFEQIDASEESILASVALLVQLLRSFLTIRFNALLEHYDLPTEKVARIQPQLLFQPPGMSHAVTRSPPSHLSFRLILARMMRQKSWCRFRIGSTCAQSTYHLAYYLSSLQRPSQPGIDHQICSYEECKAYIALAGPMVPLHRIEDCPCHEIGPDMTVVKAIIAAGGIPLMRLTRDLKGQINLGVVRASWHTRYVAISHVWSDRQFGSSKNSLWQCQLEAIERTMLNLPQGFGRGLRPFDSICGRVAQSAHRCGLMQHATAGDQLFWLDTLCIPCPDSPDPQHHILRTKAINMMDLIYAGSNEVLVPDRELQNVKSGSQAIVELGEGLVSQCWNELQVPHYNRLTAVLGHLLCSAWMGRAWTLQEGVLARDCTVQFNDSTTKLNLVNAQSYNYMPGRWGAPGGSRLWQSLCWWWVGARREPPSDKSLGMVTNHSKNRGCLRKIWELVLAFALYVLSLIMLPFLYHSYLSDFYGERHRGQRRDVTQHFATEVVVLELFQAITRSLGTASQRTASDSNLTSVWNALVGRSTQKPEDIHTVLANLLGFNAGYIMQSQTDPGERMKAILYSLDFLPLSMLFITTKKMHEQQIPTLLSKDRWIPLSVEHQELTRSSMMTFTPEGFCLEANHDSRNAVVMLQSQITSRTPCYLPTTSKASRTARRTANEDDSTTFYRVEFAGPASQKCITRSNSLEESCLIVEHTGGNVRRGAHLFISKVEGDKIYLRYDCAVRLTASREVEDIETPLYTWRLAPNHARFYLEHGADASRLRFPKRPLNTMHGRASAINMISFISSIVVFVLLQIVFGFTMNKIFPFTSRSTLNTSRATEVIYIIIITVWIYVILIYGLVLPYKITAYILQVIGYKAWAVTFDQDWQPGEKDKYRHWRKFMNFVSKFSFL